MLFEAFVPGPEVTVNGFTAEGRAVVAAVTDRIHFEDAPGVARCHVYPPERDPAAAAEIATRAVAALGIGAGPWYVQVILGPGGPRIVEVAARLGGGHDSELVKLVTGVDLARAAVLAALDRPVAAADVTPDHDGAGVIRFLEAPPGTLVRAAGPPDACFYDAPGHVYGPIRIATDRAGYVLAGGATRDAALARAAAAAASRPLRDDMSRARTSRDLAIDGGTPVRETLLEFSPPIIGRAEIDSVVATLRVGVAHVGPARGRARGALRRVRAAPRMRSQRRRAPTRCTWRCGLRESGRTTR